MCSNEYWSAVTTLRAEGFKPVHDFFHYPPPIGAEMVYLEGPCDGPGYGPWWTGGIVGPAVSRMVDMVDSYKVMSI